MERGWRVPEFENFDDWRHAVDERTAQVWAANEAALEFDPWHRPGLGVEHATHGLADHSDAALHAVRLDVFQRLMDFLWAEGPDPLRMMRRAFVLTRCGSPQHLAHMNQTDVSVLLNETRAATSARELKVWRSFLIERGFFGGTKRPLMKGQQARATYHEAAQGNHNREGGKKAIRKYSVLREEHAKSQATKRTDKSKAKPCPK